MSKTFPIPVIRVLATVLVLAVGLTALHAGELPDKHPLDKSESRTLVLDNGLRVLLVSDPELNISAASMAVGVGSLSDPDDAPGLAHFLEHMLFLGTEKYPDESEYSEYLTQNGGYSNAYTAADHTNYHFEVYPSAFEGALDRFAQFFIAPLFTPEFTEREMNAVDSEHAKNLESDGWRGYQLFRNYTLPDHPENRFATGNLETLSNVEQSVLIDFYEQYYSANEMALTLVSTHNLDQLEAWVREYFASIENRELATIRFPEQFIEKKDTVRLIYRKSLEDSRNLFLRFNTPGIREDWDAKSSQLIGSILGYEGKGSLLSFLKEANLATGLGAAMYEGTIDYTTTVVSISLTPEGQADPGTVLEYVMGYIEMMRQSPYPESFYTEQATMARLKEVYSDKGEGSSRAVALANRALTLPLEVAENAPTTYLRMDPDFYFALLERLRPDNMMAILSARDVETDRIEPVYGTEYRYTEIGGDLFDRLAKPTVQEAFTLPQANPFVPETVKLLSEQPVRLIDEPGLSLYFAQDREFQRPKVAMSFRARMGDRAYTARDAVLIELYQAAVNEYVNEMAYDALMADLGYSIAAGLESVSVSLFGYTESASKLLPVLVDALIAFEIEEARFEAIKDQMVRGWSNERLGNAFQYIRYYTNKASHADYFMPDELAEAAADVQLADVYALRDTLFEAGKIESLVYGNMSATQAIESARMVEALLGMALPEDGLYENQLVEMAPGEVFTYKEVLPTNNSVFRKEFTLGMATPELRVAAAVLANLIQTPYYSEMRTRQQLGYVVWSFQFTREDEIRMSFLIQSGEYDPLELVDRSDTLIASLPEILQSMPDEAFERAKDAVRSEIEEKDKTIAEKATRFFDLAYEHGANWSRKQESLDALDNLTREEVIALMESVNDTESSRHKLILLFARQEAETAETVEAYTDISEWKDHQPLREVTEL